MERKFMSPTAANPPLSLSSALARGLTVGATAMLVQLVLLALVLELCGVVSLL